MKRSLPAKKLIITLVIVVGVLVAADFGAATVAEYQVAQKMRTELDLKRDPEVRINGFPFLTQAAAGDFRDVEIKARGVDVGEFTEVGVQAELHHAHVSTADVLAGSASSLQVDEVLGRVRLKAGDIGRFIGVDDLAITPAPASALKDEQGSDGSGGSGSGDSGDSGSGQGSDVKAANDPTTAIIRLDGTVNIAGTDNTVTVLAVLSLVDGKLRISPRELKLDNSTIGPIDLPEMFEKSVLRRFTATLDPGKLPFRVTPTAVRVEKGALVVEGTASNVTIDAHGLSTGG